MPQCAGTRPATDLVRSAIFSILEFSEAGWSKVLDLFAGSGAIGLEALSRGAEWVDFVDHERRCCLSIKQNAEAMGFASKTRVYCEKVPRALSALKGPYGLIFLDPPYADETSPEIMERLASSQLLGKDTVVTLLHSARSQVQTSFGRLRIIKQRRHGDTMISMYQEGSKL